MDLRSKEYEEKKSGRKARLITSIDYRIIKNRLNYKKQVLSKHLFFYFISELY